MDLRELANLTTSTSPTPSRTFALAGTYTVTLTVTDAWGRQSSTTRQVTFTEPAGNAAPTAVIGSPSCSGLTCSISSSGSADPNGDAVYRVWDFGDGTAPTAPSTSTTGTHTYANPGTYAVKLTVNDGYGKSSTISTSVTVTAPPTP